MRTFSLDVNRIFSLSINVCIICLPIYLFYFQTSSQKTYIMDQIEKDLTDRFIGYIINEVIEESVETVEEQVILDVINDMIVDCVDFSCWRRLECHIIEPLTGNAVFYFQPMSFRLRARQLQIS